MRRLAAGHDASLNDLMERHGERLFRFLVRELGNEAEAGDLSEETFVRVYQNRHRYDEGHRFTTWLFAIATNLVRDKYRWRSRHPEVAVQSEREDSGTSWLNALPDPSPNPGEDLERTERADAVRRAIAALPEELKTPLILSAYEGMSHAEIGEVVGGSPKAVEMRIYRAKQQLRQHLTGLLKEA